MEYLGWHGTTKRRKDKILKENFTFNKYTLGVPEQRLPNDLGAGVYFFIKFLNDNGNLIAKKYAEKFKSKEILKNNTSVGLIKASIDTSTVNELNLNDSVTKAYFDKFRQIAHEEIEQEFVNLKDDGAKQRAKLFNPKKVDGIVIEMLNQRLMKDRNLNKDAFSVLIKDTYTDLNSLRRDEHGNNGTEICVRDIKIITIIPEEG